MLAVAMIGLINAIFWPLLSKILLPLVVLTVGLLSWVINGAVIWLAGQFINGFYVAGVPSAYATFVGDDEVTHHSGIDLFHPPG